MSLVNETVKVPRFCNVFHCFLCQCYFDQSLTKSLGLCKTACKQCFYHKQSTHKLKYADIYFSLNNKGALAMEQLLTFFSAKKMALNLHTICFQIYNLVN